MDSVSKDFASLPGTLLGREESGGGWSLGLQGRVGATVARGFYLACYHLGGPMAEPGGEMGATHFVGTSRG